MTRLCRPAPPRRINERAVLNTQGKRVGHVGSTGPTRSHSPCAGDGLPRRFGTLARRLGIRQSSAYAAVSRSNDTDNHSTCRFSRSRMPNVRPTSSPVVLLADDNASHAKFMTRCFRAQLPDVDVRHVRDGEEALDYLMQRGQFRAPADAPRPNLLLLDLRLPRLDGFQVLERIKSAPSLCEIPTVILSTSHRDSDIERAYELDANSYLVKPLDFDKFSELIGQIARFWLAWNRTT